MGLLDQFSALPAEQQQAINSGLLSMAGALLTPQWKGGGMGAAFQAFPAAIDRAQQQSRQNKMLTLQEQQLGLQTDEARRKAEAQARQQEALAKLLSDPAFANNPAAAALLGIGQADKAVERAYPAPQKPTFQTWYENGQQRSGFVAPGQAPQPVGEAKPAESSALGKLIAERDKFPEGHPLRRVYDDAIAKSTTHQPATTVNVNSGQKDTMWGEPPKGFVWARDPASGQVITQPDKSGAVAPMALPIAGSKEAREREEAQGKQAQRQQYAQNVAGTILSTVSEAKKMVGPLSAGFGGSIMGNVPGSPAVDLRALIDPIKANIGFQRLQEMRDMSPTGGALGQVAVQELNMLQSVVSSLDQNQSPEQLRKSFDKIEKHFNNWLRVMTQADGGAPQGGSPTKPSGGWSIQKVE